MYMLAVVLTFWILLINIISQICCFFSDRLKALVSTGGRSLQAACDWWVYTLNNEEDFCNPPHWTNVLSSSGTNKPFLYPRLFSHVDDPFLDDPLPREFVLYLRPSGPLQNQLSHFWQQSRVTCGKNKAHNIFPHITLCQFFMVSQDRPSNSHSKWPGS